ncbi:ABC transporter substrate-binding protein [Clostridium estertheticum]|nr:sugar ABC transporter substrate-binding protein [Clostridium estertheticum]
MMKISKKLMTLVLTTAIIGTTLAGCSSKTSSTQKSSSDKIQLSVTTWNYDTTPEFKALFEAFHKANPNITIKPIDIDASQYDNKVTTMLAGGDSTDVLTMKNTTSYSGYAFRGQLEDLTTHVKPNVANANYKGAYDYLKIDDKYYAQPYRTDFFVLYYNKTMFDKAKIAYPENLTWDQYATLAQKLTVGTGSTKQYGAYNHTWRSIVQATASAQTNSDLVSGKYDFMKPYYETFLKMQKSGSSMEYGTAKSTSSTYASQFETGKAAMLPMGTWYMAGVLNSKKKGATDVNWGITAMPQNESNSKVTTFGSPTAFAINKKSKQKEAAQKFLDFASGEKGATVLASVGVVPAYRTDVINKSYFDLKGMPTDAISKKAFSPDKIALEMPVNKHSAAIDQVLTEEHDLIMVGGSTIDKAIASMSKRVLQEIKE